MLKATNFDFQDFKVTGSGVEISHLSFTTLPTASRKVTDQSSRIYVRDASNFTITNVTVDDGSSAGIFISNSTNGTVSNSLVKNTRADAIHITNKSSFITINGNKVRNSGDDMIATVSYGKDGGLTHDITVTNNDVAGNYWGRGITVVGGEDVTIQNNNISDTRFAGVYIAAEVVYGTYGVNNVTVTGNQIYRGGSTRDMGAHGAIQVYANGGNVTGLNVTYNDVYDSKLMGVHLNGGSNHGAIFSHNLFSGTYSGEALYIDTSFKGSLQFTNNTAQNTAERGVNFYAPQTGNVEISGNAFKDTNRSGQSATADVIYINNGNLNSLKIQNNTHTNASGNPVNYFINEYVNAATQLYSGNASPKQSFINGQAVATP
jgi:parallel beta-helix repeat protein